MVWASVGYVQIIAHKKSSMSLLILSHSDIEDYRRYTKARLSLKALLYNRVKNERLSWNL
jgi:glutamate 5-kinase